MATLTQIQNLFFSSPKFAVVGASKDQSKFGTKVLKWYQARDIDVTPIHPKEAELEGLATIPGLTNLPDPSHTSVSVITPAKITLSLLQQAKELDVPALWLQPGAEDEAVRNFIKENGLGDKVILGGPCVLVQGDGVIERLKAEKSAL